MWWWCAEQHVSRIDIVLLLTDGAHATAAHSAAVSTLAQRRGRNALAAQVQAALHLDVGSGLPNGFDRIEVPPVCASGSLPNLDLVRVLCTHCVCVLFVCLSTPHVVRSSRLHSLFRLCGCCHRSM